jgi:hypothetical protein
MTEDQEERLVVAFEQIALTLRGIHDTGQKEFARRWPERKEVREAVVTRIPTDEDRIREEHGAGGDEPLQDWLNLPPEGEWIGLREQEFNARTERAR